MKAEEREAIGMVLRYQEDIVCALAASGYCTKQISRALEVIRSAQLERTRKSQ